MGYESKFYIVVKTSLSPDKDGLTYSQVIALFDMCKMGYASETLEVVKKSPDTDCFFFADDGETRIIKDKYGDKLKEINKKKLLAALKNDDDGYRRIKPFVAFLKSLTKKNWSNLKILHFGH